MLPLTFPLVTLLHILPSLHSVYLFSFLLFFHHFILFIVLLNLPPTLFYLLFSPLVLTSPIFIFRHSPFPFLFFSLSTFHLLCLHSYFFPLFYLSPLSLPCCPRSSLFISSPPLLLTTFLHASLASLASPCPSSSNRGAVTSPVFTL